MGRKSKAAKEAKTYTPQTEWIKNRLRDRGVNIDRAAAKIETSKLIFHRLLNGSRAPRPDEIIALGELMGVTTIEALRRFGYTVPNSRVDLIGRVNEHGRIVWFAPPDCRKVDAPADAEDDTRALVVDASHSRLAIFDGAVLYYSPAKIVDARAVGRLSVIEASDQPAPLVGVLMRVSGNKSHVQIIGGQESFETRGLLSAAPVSWIRNL